MNKLLTCKNVWVSFKGKEVLKDVNFEISSGETISLIWKNWCWKSTFIKAILDINKYTWEITKHTDKVSYVPQKLDFDKTIPLTSLEFINLYNSWKTKQKALEILKGFKSEHLLNMNLWTLSWWELQKILITNALIGNPELLLLDEPTAWIDKIWEEDFYNLISKIKETYPKLWIILVSHNINMIYSHSDKILYLHEKCYCFGTPKEIIENTKDFSDKLLIPFVHKHSHNHNH